MKVVCNSMKKLREFQSPKSGHRFVNLIASQETEEPLKSMFQSPKSGHRFVNKKGRKKLSELFFVFQSPKSGHRFVNSPYLGQCLKK